MFDRLKKWTRSLVGSHAGEFHNILSDVDKHWQLLRESSDLELADRTEKLRLSIQRQESSAEARPLAFALVKEAVRRVLRITMHDVQLIGGFAMTEGKVVEMMTGEGKTVVSLLPTFWFALQGKGVHMITVNSYLAERDFQQASRVFGLLGLSVGLNVRELTIEEKQAEYGRDITYGTWSEFGFDYLRDHLVYDASQKVQRGLSYAILDEVDSVLIDEAKTPMIIAGKAKAAPDLYYVCTKFVRNLREGRDYESDSETRQVMFTDAGIRKIEATFLIDNLYDLEYTTVYHYLLQSLRAYVLMQADRDYLVAEGKVKIIDAFTGRIMDGREFGDGLHQAIEAKEGLPLSEETRSHASVTVQKFFASYQTLVGMSGTIQTDREEMEQIYGLDVLPITPHKPVIRQDLPDLIFATKAAKYKRLVEEIEARQKVGQPVLVGTTSIRQSLEIADLLAEAGYDCQVLNAKTESEEAEIIGKAGERGAITIATNMAGRGTDIRLGVGVAELGGLHVIGTERHESRRIDLQLCGRSGRQGDPGSTQFFISLEDELIRRFAADDAAKWLERWRWGDYGISRKELLLFVESVQRRVEQHLFDIRSLVFQFDCIVHEQREWFYAHRDQVLRGKEIENYLLSCMEDYLNQLVATYCPADRVPEEWEPARLLAELRSTEPLPITEMTQPADVVSMLRERWIQRWVGYLRPRDSILWRRQWRENYLQLLDRLWLEHLELLEQLKQGIHYRAYANKNPVQAYREEAFRLFQKLERKTMRQVSQKWIEEVADGAEQSSRPAARTG